MIVAFPFWLATAAVLIREVLVWLCAAFLGFLELVQEENVFFIVFDFLSQIYKLSDLC